VTAKLDAKELGLGPVPYYTFGLGRALVLAGVKSVNGKDWHRIGSEAILAVQQKDGSWYGGAAGSVDVLETCWHLLFLSRASVPA